jgi:hypothetical protein
MKSIIKISIIAGFGLTFFVACKKGKAESKMSITGDDAADVIAASIGTSAYGSTAISSDAAQKTFSASTTVAPCLYGLDTSFSRSNIPGSNITYTYNLNYKYQMYCSNAILQSMVFNLTTNGNLESIRLSVVSDASGIITFTGLLPTSQSYTANGTYTRNGSVVSKVRNKNAFTYQLDLKLVNLSISKSNYSV